MTGIPIALDRLLALHLRHRYRIIVTSRRVMVIQVFLLLFAVLMEVCWRATMATSVGAAILLDALTVVCIFTSTIAFARVCWRLRYHQLQVHGNTEHSNSSSLPKARYRKSVLISYLPHACVTAMIFLEATVNGFDSTTILVMLVTSSVLFTDSCVNPFLYCWGIRELASNCIAVLAQCWTNGAVPRVNRKQPPNTCTSQKHDKLIIPG